MRWLSLIGALAVGAALALSGCRSVTSPAAMPAAATINERALVAGTIEHYRFIEQHRELAEQVACYCGCAKTLGHRFLRDCFVRDDGRLDAHAQGCGVCLAEANEVARLAGEGASAAIIAAGVDAMFSESGPSTRENLR